MYGKLFAQMYDGTLGTRGPWQALVAFQQLIILADKYGQVDMTADAVARRTTIPVDIITVGIAALELPDPDSRSPDEDGRRIVKIDPERSWGWRIVNYDHYRKIRSEEERREYHRKYMRDRRAKANSTNGVTASEGVNPALRKSTNSSKQYAGSKKQEAERGETASTSLPMTSIHRMESVLREAIGLVDSEAALPVLDGAIRAAHNPTAFVAGIRAIGPGGTQEAGTWEDVARAIIAVAGRRDGDLTQRKLYHETKRQAQARLAGGEETWVTTPRSSAPFGGEMVGTHTLKKLEAELAAERATEQANGRAH